MSAPLSLRVFRHAKALICFEVKNASDENFRAASLRVMFGPVYVAISPLLKALPATSSVQFLSNGETQVELDSLISNTPWDDFSIELFNNGVLLHRWPGTLLHDLYEPPMSDC